MNIYGKVLFSEVLKIVLFPFRLQKIRKNRIVFTGLTGGTSWEYSGNPMYLCEDILKNSPEKYEMIWIVSEPETYRFLKEKGIHVTRHFSLASFRWLLTAKVIISNGSYAPWFPFRAGQYFVNTWHGGGAYKKIENSKPGANWATRRRARFCAENIDLFISTCKVATKELIRGSFCYTGEVMEVGMPRNDFLVRQEVKTAREAVIRYYGLNEETKILLYAPTYRDSSMEVVLDGDALQMMLERNGETWVLLYRAHRYQNAQMKIRMTGKQVKNASMYPDMQELLAAADMMITDYSSNIWDYSFLYRPCFLYTPDVEEYLEKTGFYVDIHEWPFKMARTQEELYHLIENYDAVENQKRIDAHHKRMGAAESGHACEEIEKRIAEVCGI